MSRHAWEMTPEERAAEVEHLRATEREALAAPLMSHGEISATQVNRMGKAQRQRWQQNAVRRMAVEARIRDLRQSDEELDRDRRRHEAQQRKEAASRIDHLHNHIRMLKAVGTGKRGLRKKYAEAVARCEAEITTLEESLQPCQQPQ